MDALTIIQLTSAVLQLSSKYIAIAQQSGELSPDETEKFLEEFKRFTESPAWKIEPDPEG